jgi:lipoprotein signal peptidase
MTNASYPAPTPRRHPARRQLIPLALIGSVVIAVDQVGKALAWRGDPDALVNHGGFFFLGQTIRGWFAHPLIGSVADCVAWILLAIAVWWFQRKRRDRLVLIGAALVMAGFASNLTDRLGLHRLTAPGSTRGVVDFIPTGGTSRSNLADLAIAAGVVLLTTIAARRVAARRRAGPADATNS